MVANSSSLFLVFVFSLSTLLINAQVSIEEAAYVAKNFFNQKSAAFNAATSPEIVSHRMIASENGLPLFHLFSFEEGGYVITTTEKNFYPVLAWSPQATFDPDQMPENCSAWMQWYAKQIETGSKKGETYFAGASSVWDQYLNVEAYPAEASTFMGIAPLLTVKWDQGKFYNAMCPPDDNGVAGHAPVGCVATAMAMVMYYYRFPEQGNGAHSYTPPHNGGIYGVQFSDFGNTTYRWDEMVDQCFTWNDAIAELSYHCGVAVNMKYSPGGSGANTSDVPEALINHFHYSPAAELYNRSSFSAPGLWQQMLIDQLEKGQPVLYRSSANMLGHAYVCDGYHDSVYFHFNWGWSGNHNGYYYINELIPGGLDLSHNQGGIFHIYPDTALFDYPPFCQGIKLLTSNTGSINDGSGPLSPLPNSHCAWLVKPDDPAITNLQVEFTMFDLEEGNDFLHLYNGQTADAPLIGSFTGNILPPLFTTAGPALFIELESSEGNGGSGFHANYHAISLPFCDGLTIITEPDGYLEDGSMYLNYTTQQDCRWLLSPEVPVHDSVEKIRVQFTRFDVAAGDTLFVYDGADEHAPLLASLSGHSLPSQIISGSNRLFLHFLTSEGDSAGGWEIRHRPLSPVYCSDTTYLAAPQGNIEDGSGGKHYAENTRCFWKIEIAEADFVTFEFTKVDIELNYDYVLIRDLNTPFAQPVRITGNTIPPPFTIHSNRILISFFTDQRDNRSGWELNYHASAEHVHQETLQPFTLYPNPVTDAIFIHQKTESRKLNYRLFDLKGFNLLSGESFVQKTRIEMATLEHGIYLLEINIDGQTFHQKIVKL
jgi:hypothetical protein